MSNAAFAEACIPCAWSGLDSSRLPPAMLTTPVTRILLLLHLRSAVIALLDDSDEEPAAVAGGAAAPAAGQPWSAWEDGLLQQGLEVRSGWMACDGAATCITAAVRNPCWHQRYSACMAVLLGQKPPVGMLSLPPLFRSCRTDLGPGALQDCDAGGKPQLPAGACSSAGAGGPQRGPGCRGAGSGGGAAAARQGAQAGEAGGRARVWSVIMCVHVHSHA